MSFDFPFVRLFGVRYFCYYLYHSVTKNVDITLERQFVSERIVNLDHINIISGRRRDRMVVGFITTYAISIYYH